MDLVGNTLSRYHIRAKIGLQTGIVELYEAYDPILEREVEIKVLFPSRVKDKEVVQRFRLDAYTVSQLTHPNIISVPAQWNKEPLYIVTEATDDESLRELIQQDAPLDLLPAMSLLEQIAAGLDYAHTRSVIHQDLRPDQILIKAQSQVQIKNFKLFPDDERFKKTSKAEKEIMAYVAPEVIQNQALTPQTDIYALGIIAYELLAGHPPFQGKKDEVLDAHLTQSPASLHQSNSRIPVAVDRVIAKALAKTPSERYLTASAFVHALGQALDDSTSSRLVKPSSPSPSPSSLRQARPPRSKLSRFAWDKIAMIFVILCSCEIIRLSIMQIIITPVSVPEVTTEISIPTPISLASSTPTGAPTSTIEISLVNNNEPDNKEEPTNSTSIGKEATPSTTPTVDASSTATIKASATATEAPSATATEEPSATATAEPSATATAEPSATATSSATATEIPLPTATKIPLPTATEAPPPTATEVVGPPSANISNIQINHSTPKNGQIGIQYLIDFTVENGQGVSSQLGVHFYDSLGNTLTDQNNFYGNADGEVFVGQYFIPESNSESYTEFELFIPYRELDLGPGLYELQFDVKLFYGPEFIVLDQRGFEEFTATIE